MKVLDLFCGCGGMSLGLEQAGLDILLGVDIDPVHAGVPDTHQINFRHPVLIGDIKSPIIVLQMPARSKAPDVITGGPPCQGFSSIGKRDKSDPRNSLIEAFSEYISLMMPKFFVMENVPGLMNEYGKEYLDAFVDYLELAGYNITKPIRTLDASDFGIPQSRERVFVLGAREDLGVTIPYPEPIAERVTVWEAICDLPKGMKCDDVAIYDVSSSPTNPIVSKQRTMATAQRARRNASTIFVNELSGNRRSNHTQKTIDLYAATDPGAIVPSHRLPRLHPDGLCPTLRAGTDKKRGAHTAARPVHPFEPRCITVREAARLHGYPDWFQFDKKLYNAYRQIGNSVCPPVAKAIGKEIIKCLNL